MSAKKQRHAFDTRLVHAGESPDPATGAHGVPLYQNTTYAFRSFDQLQASNRGEVPRFFYQRYGNPTVRCLELKMADLEGAEQCVATATGMTAISAVLEEMVGCDGHLIAATDLYQVSHEVIDADVAAMGCPVSKVEIWDIDQVRKSVRPNTSVIFAESLSNPRIDIADVRQLAEIAHEVGAVLVVDNTFLSPSLYRPLADGADLVVHSATKYLSGTGQVMGGFVSGSNEVVARIRARLARSGGTMQPFAAWQILSGIKTLSLRMDRHSASAQQIAELLDWHDAVQEVRYPTLPGCRGFSAEARVNDERHGGLLSFTLKGGESSIRAFIDSLELFTIAVSLGEASSLVWPYADGTIRLSIGLEDSSDLLQDVTHSLDSAANVDLNSAS